MGKKEYLIDELGEGTVELMRSVKDAIDPLNIMNPSKVRLHQLWRIVSQTCKLMRGFTSCTPSPETKTTLVFND